MAKITLTDIGSGYGSTTVINANNALIETAMENTLSRDGTSPNQMQAGLDMNSNRITNLPNASNNTEPVTLGQASSIQSFTGVVATAGAVGEVLWPQTSAESSAGVTPTNYEYEPGNVLRYGTNTTPGTTDMTTAIQAAIDSTADVILPYGTYYITGAITGTTTRIFGNNSTITLADATFGAFQFSGSNCIIQDLIIDGAGTTGQWSNNGTNFGIKFTGYSATNNIVRNCTLKDLVFIGVELKSSYSTVTDCYFENCGFGAVYSYNKENSILNSRFVSCANATSSYTGNVISVTYSAPDGYTMATTLGKRNTISGNQITTSAQVGIDSHSGQHLVITDNVISACDLDGIYLHRTSPAAESLTDTDGRVTNCVVANNVIYACLTGVYFSSTEPSDATDRTGCVNNLVEGNNIYECTSIGIGLARGTNGTTVTANHIEDCPRLVYLFYWCDNNYIHGNTFVAGSTTSGAMVRLNTTGTTTNYCDYNVIENNVFDLQSNNINGIDNNNARYSRLKMNEFLNRGNSYPIEDGEAGTARQAQIVHFPRAYTTAGIASVSDMVGEVIHHLTPSAGGTIGWVCTTAGDESSTSGTWKTFGSISA